MDIPAHLADILKVTVKGQTKINLEITGSEEPLSQLDSMMNKMNGAELIQAIRKRSVLPVLVLSSDGSIHRKELLIENFSYT